MDINIIVPLLTVLVAAWIGGLIATKLGYPSMLGELTIGIIIGPPVLGLVVGSKELFVLSEVGILLMMLYIGLEVDPAQMLKSSKAAILAAIGGFVIPFAAGFGLIWFALADQEMEPIKRIAAACFVGMAMGVTSLATKSRILLDLKLLDTRIAMVMMAGALFSDTAALVVFAGVMGFAEGGQLNLMQLGLVTIKAVTFFGIAIVLGQFGFKWLFRGVRWLGVSDRMGTFMVLFILALSFGELAHLMGLHAVLGAFLAGMFVKRGIPQREAFEEAMETVHMVAMTFLAPVFFVTAGFAFDIKVFSNDLGLLIAVVSVAMISKIVGTMLFYLPSGYGWRESLVVGMGMNDRGAVEIIVAGIALHAGLIDGTIYSILVFTALFTTALVPFSLKKGTAWLESRGELDRLHERKRLLLVGSGPLARLIARYLSPVMPVTLIDRNVAHCDAARAEGFTVVEGNALDLSTMEDAGALEASGLVGLTGNAEVNLMSSQMAREKFLVPNGLALLPGKSAQRYEGILARIGASALCSAAPDPAYWDRLIALNQVREERHRVERDTTAGTLGRERGGFPLIGWLGATPTPMLLNSATPLAAGVEVLTLHAATVEPPQADRFDSLVRESVCLDLPEAMDRLAFFEKAAATLSPIAEMPVAELVEAFEQRELESGTVLGNGLAIPHILLPGEGRFHMLIARSRPGIGFDENALVHMVFVLMGSRDERNMHLRCLSAIAQIVQGESFAARWMDAANPEALQKLVLDAPRQRR